MAVSIGQSILIGLWSGFCLVGQMWGIYTNRSLVLSLGVGLILGDIPTALAMGAVSEIAFMGFGVGAGGTVPPNQLGPGIVGTLMAITMKESGMDTGTALALSFPFAVAFQFLITLTYTALSGTSTTASKAIKEGKFNKFKVISNITIFAFFIVGFVVGFGSSVSMKGVEKFVNLIPEWLTNGLTVAGGMLPAIGFAMILNVMAKKEYIPFVILGYVCVAYLELPVMGTALVALVFALYDYYSKGDKNNQEEATQGGI